LNRDHRLVFADVRGNVESIREVVVDVPVYLLCDLFGPVIAVCCHASTVSPSVKADASVGFRAALGPLAVALAVCALGRRGARVAGGHRGRRIRLAVVAFVAPVFGFRARITRR
jgi:hypothetical protein